MSNTQTTGNGIDAKRIHIIHVYCKIEVHNYAT